jgi:stalled ribosome alternative rescue factor ArfA
MIELIDSFYIKAKIKIEKTLTKDNKKTAILCEEIFRALAHHPKQELYEISRLNDAFFN